jgi:hypothetical protein
MSLGHLIVGFGKSLGNEWVHLGNKIIHHVRTAVSVAADIIMGSGSSKGDLAIVMGDSIPKNQAGTKKPSQEDEPPKTVAYNGGVFLVKVMEPVDMAGEAGPAVSV